MNFQKFRHFLEYHRIRVLTSFALCIMELVRLEMIVKAATSGKLVDYVLKDKKKVRMNSLESRRYNCNYYSNGWSCILGGGVIILIGL